MSVIGIRIREIRFTILDRVSWCYVRVDSAGQAPLIDGWHGKEFSSSINLCEILMMIDRQKPWFWPVMTPVENAPG